MTTSLTCPTTTDTVTSRSKSSAPYTAAADRYAQMSYRRCGQSGLQLPPISLGFWQHAHDRDLVAQLCCSGFDQGLCHFDVANNYGPPPGIAESNLGHVLQHELKAHRDELIISTKAGYDMWPGPYGNFGSRKYMVASLDQSLQRLGLDYVDIFYHHRPDPQTPLEETMGALADCIRQGKALYAGLSNYNGERISDMARLAQEMQVPLIINQVKYSMLHRQAEQQAIDISAAAGQGVIAFSPLEQGLLSNRYLHGIPPDSRAGKGINNLRKRLSPALMKKLNTLNSIARAHDQDLAQLALQWVLRKPAVCSVIIGASRVEQLHHNLQSLHQPALSASTLAELDTILATD